MPTRALVILAALAVLAATPTAVSVLLPGAAALLAIAVATPWPVVAT